MSYDEATDHAESDEVICTCSWRPVMSTMTLDELDGAFQNGVIHEGTYLWQEGATGW